MSGDDLLRFHGVVPPATPCERCGEPRSAHKQDVDTNGWRITGYTAAPLPKDWPVYSATTGTWSNI